MYHNGLMRILKNARQALARLFDRRPIVDLRELFRTLNTRSRMTVFRRLNEVGYLTSYSHAGRFYTLRHLPQFDASGLWQHQSVCFSRQGTLKETVVRMVEEAERGRFHRDLREQLQVRVHNTLHDLVRHRRIDRRPFAGEYLYVSADKARSATQVAHRKEQAGRTAESDAEKILPAAPAVVIAVLLEVIHGAKVTAEATGVAKRLRGRGIPVSAEQVQAILTAHGLEKKTPPAPSRRSRR
mgnify:FL=1